MKRRRKQTSNRPKSTSPTKTNEESQKSEVRKVHFDSEPDQVWESYRTEKLTITTQEKTEKTKSVQTRKNKAILMDVALNISDEEGRGRLPMLK